MTSLIFGKTRLDIPNVLQMTLCIEISKTTPQMDRSRNYFGGEVLIILIIFGIACFFLKNIVCKV